jgi:uncharacterized RDD family membrane protein YckC
VSGPPPESLRPVAAVSAGFVSRLLAMSIDIAVIALTIAAIGSFAQLVQVILPRWIWISSAVPVVAGVIVSFVPVTYFFLGIAIAGRTPGKALLGLRVVSTRGGRLPVMRSLLRTVAYLVSLVPLGLGFVWILLNRDRRGWHDHIAGSRVIYERPPERL